MAARDDVRWRGGGEQHMQTPRSAQRCPQRQVVCQTMIWDPPLAFALVEQLHGPPALEAGGAQGYSRACAPGSMRWCCAARGGERERARGS